MKLELKYLAPYLPYRLQVEIERLKYPCGKEIVELNLKNIEQFDNKKMWKFKPILRPMSDLHNTELTYKEKATEKSICNNDDYVIEKDFKKTEIVSASFYLWLISEHFDVFGLIEKGLAIDINTLNT